MVYEKPRSLAGREPLSTTQLTFPCGTLTTQVTTVDCACALTRKNNNMQPASVITGTAHVSLLFEMRGFQHFRDQHAAISDNCLNILDLVHV